jgi:tetratricopeptide (TPR) repeat protein
VRARFVTAVVVALGALVAGALGIAVTLATSDSAKWPAWLRPYHRWGWWAVLVLFGAATILAVWQFTHQLRDQPLVASATTVNLAGRQNDGWQLAVIGNTAQQQSTRPIVNLPPRNLAFIGRAGLLDRLRRQLTATPGTPTAVAVTALTDTDRQPTTYPSSDYTPRRAMTPRVLHGLGGVGKSQLVLEYAYRHAPDYRIRWWIPAEQPAAISGHLVALARQLGIPEYAEQTETITALLAELSQRDDWLLIFDNAEDPHDLYAYWPPASEREGGQVLITSRNPNWQPLAVGLPVDVLPRADAIAFLRRRAGMDKTDADKLAQALGDLPLALEQAAAYLEQTHTAPDQYLQLLRTRAPDLFALGRPATSEQTIATIWALSLQRLGVEAPAAEDLLVLCAFLAPDDIPRWLLEDHPDVLPEPLADAVQDRVAFQQALGALGQYSMASVTDETVSVHRLVQAVVRHGVSPEQRTIWAATAVQLVAAAFPEHAEYVETWPIAMQLLPQALAAGEHADAVRAEPMAVAAVFHGAGRYLWGRGDLDNARALFERALAIHEAHLGADDPTTAKSLNYLAVVLRDQGRLDRARILHERALAIREAHLGADHPDTATSLNNLAVVLRDQGDLERARTLYERALAIHEARMGVDHPATAQSLSNLAITLASQGDLDQARNLHERALAIREAWFGTDHPVTAGSLSNLAGVLGDQGDLERARTLYERALAIRETRLGADHPETLRSRAQLARIVSTPRNRQ